jgi:hypothetical protein
LLAKSRKNFFTIQSKTQDHAISVIEFIKKHKERVALIGLGVAFLLFIGGGLYLQKDAKREREPQIKAPATPVKLNTQKYENERKQTESTAVNGLYFLEPSPEKLLEQLASMENLNAAVVDAKYSQLPVLWPAYFFSLRKVEGNPSVLLLDVSEDGFGVVIESEIDSTLYPELERLSIGDKVWIGGKILAVDRAGTGTIYLTTDELSFGADAPFSQTSQESKE